MAKPNRHLFHIPVMGTGFTIDTPLKVARFGISSVISLMDDLLIERVRKYYCMKIGEEYIEIRSDSEDSIAKRITAYLNMLDRLIKMQIETMRGLSFDNNSDLVKYFEFLPDSELRRAFYKAMNESDPIKKAKMQDYLRGQIEPGGIDVNVMTKVNQDAFVIGKKLSPEFSRAMASFRGYAKSTLGSSVIFSAGTNTSLYSYISKFKDFLPDKTGQIKKKIILKVSDYRSGIIQGKFLAKKGLWVSEFRIESGLNCGGHAFASKGLLLGPVLKEFREKRDECKQSLFGIYSRAIKSMGIETIDEPIEQEISVQGGIGTCDERIFLEQHYNVDATGWGTPFLLVPEVVNVDIEHLQKLAESTESDVCLSDSSPLDVPFWRLNNSASEIQRLKRIVNNTPGSNCRRGILMQNTELTKVPLCTASREYQKRKLKLLVRENLTPEIFEHRKNRIMEKACICNDLGGGIMKKIEPDINSNPAICCGPNIVNFSQITSLEKMIDHIYGRCSLRIKSNRVHMFIAELKLYVDCLKKEEKLALKNLSRHDFKYLNEFRENLLKGIDYYRELSSNLIGQKQLEFRMALSSIKKGMKSEVIIKCQ